MSIPASLRETREERRLIDEAIAKGRVRRFPAGTSSEQDLSLAATIGRVYAARKRRGAGLDRHRSYGGEA